LYKSSMDDVVREREKKEMREREKKEREKRDIN
jgi:hypothetical protein